MNFCPKCGHILIPKEGAKKKIKLHCSACSYSVTEKEKVMLTEVMEKARRVEVVDKKMNTLPKTEMECPKCKHNIAYFWTMQTRAGDEAETRFFECTKCGHRWREYK